jgi:transposase-like protein
MTKADQRSEILRRLTEGESLSSICRTVGMPAWGTVHNWMNEEEEFAGQITRAREAGFATRADRAVEEAKDAKDAALGRLAFDAERWYLGKLSNAFSDNKAQKLEHTHDLSDKAKVWLGLTS